LVQIRRRLVPGHASALRNGVAGFAAGGSSLDRQKSRANLRVNSAMQIDDQRVREDTRGMLAPGPSCVPPAPQLKREWSLWPEFGLDPGNPRELSKG
jgi:hypothetical protein